MKAAIVAFLAGSAAASLHDRHAGLHNRRMNYGQPKMPYGTDQPMPSAPLGTGAPYPTCGCTTYTTYFYGEPTLVPNPPPVKSTVHVSPSPMPSKSSCGDGPDCSYGMPSTSAVWSPSDKHPAPTPIVTVCPTPGTYTFPATTVTLTSSTTVCAPTTTVCAPGSCTYGGVTTVVTTSTTVTCPYATVETSDSTTTSVIKTTTYVCPSAGTYTVVDPTSTSVSETTTCIYPIPTSYPPGTYTAPETTVTMTATSEVYVCPYTSSGMPSSSASVPPPAATSPAGEYDSDAETSGDESGDESEEEDPTSSAPAAPYTPPVTNSAAHPTSTPEWSYVTPSAPSTYAPAPTSSEAPKPSGHIPTNGNQWAMTYTPYTSSGQCKSASEVMSDIASIAAKGFTTVRLYATDCSGLENIGAACAAHNLKMIIGVFIDGSGIPKAREQVNAIVAWKQWHLVSMVVVGNEAVFNGYCSAEQLAAFIGECRAAFTGSGCTAPITTTETLNILQANAGALCGVIDVVAANIQPFFNAGVTPESAGSFVKGQLDLVAKCCPGKDAYNLETGWPSQGGANGAAVPGHSEQKTAIESILNETGSRSVIFSFEDDAWKKPGAFGVEQYWGCSSLF
ncbi:hypothetical protein H2201_000755 [Coniosporium apollinis]|uniref:Probable beta-glucosidase btgE n=1 Tax=Coniosporium apollinis TaxID=61459 RepID=A0ABQ9P5S4_9PEZI|nr:hypothetical protein H2201_000755 [Coniosporium apollinis]